MRNANGDYVSKLTEDTVAKIMSAMRGGASMADAAAFAGISRAILHEWMRKAREPGCEDEALLDFIAQCDEAVATWKVGAVAQLTALGNNGNSRSLEFLLERRFPDEFGSRSRVEHGNADGQPFKVQAIPMFDPELLTMEELDTVVRLLEKARPRDLPVIEAL